MTLEAIKKLRKGTRVRWTRAIDGTDIVREVANVLEFSGGVVTVYWNPHGSCTLDADNITDIPNGWRRGQSVYRLVELKAENGI